MLYLRQNVDTSYIRIMRIRGHQNLLSTNLRTPTSEMPLVVSIERQFKISFEDLSNPSPTVRMEMQIFISYSCKNYLTHPEYKLFNFPALKFLLCPNVKLHRRTRHNTFLPTAKNNRYVRVNFNIIRHRALQTQLATY